MKQHMKNQEDFDRILKDRLQDLEMNPPADLFSRIESQLAPAPKKAFWLVPNFVRNVAAALLLAAGGFYVFVLQQAKVEAPLTAVVLEPLEQLEPTVHLPASAESVAASESEIVKKNQVVKQPQFAHQRLDTKATFRVENMNRDQIEVMPVNRIQIEDIHQPTPSMSLLLAGIDVVDLAASTHEPTNGGVLPVIRNSYALLSDGGLFELARNRIDEFKNKEHYVSFNLGSVEFGQHFQINKQAEGEKTE
jgi:hypothetical protein